MLGASGSATPKADWPCLTAIGSRHLVRVTVFRPGISPRFTGGERDVDGGEFGLKQFDHGRFRTILSIDMESLRGISGIVETANGDLWLNGLAEELFTSGGEKSWKR